ncbi:hypothetical protein GCM10023194_02610 [Planotetraspora phitsanulokensis]|uniref:AMIN-like domain-containing protein n=1 Tax=Planotetraspora phitsanulokensis TaxID=575192 RepID=A0A8J3U8B4_9ACTN|nr:hypothetical protein [Planotetraspora phitsanulokensis]GII40463.1 hypothetical protein Pph01_54660 [Planotetraspora phitsanulokensis]
MKTRLALATLPLAGLVACGGTAAESPAMPSPGGTPAASAPAPPDTGGGGTPEPVESAEPTPSVKPVTPPKPAELPPPTSTKPISVERSPVPPPTVTGVRYARHASFDRVVVDLAGARTGYAVKWVPRLVQDGSGAVVKIKGGAYLQVTLFPAYAHNEAGEPTWKGPREVAAKLPNVTHVVKTGDFEGVVGVGLVLKHKAGFRVTEQSSPTRLVIDVAH